jgi:V/A-type H+-transporting ATPase subunit G/H
MQEIVSKVLEAEQQAEQTITEARQKAASIRASADAEAAAKLAEARAAAQQQLQAALAAARAEAERARREKVGKAEREASTFLDEHQGALQALVEQVVALITAPENLKG